VAQALKDGLRKLFRKGGVNIPEELWKTLNGSTNMEKKEIAGRHERQ